MDEQCNSRATMLQRMKTGGNLGSNQDLGSSQPRSVPVTPKTTRQTPSQIQTQNAYDSPQSAPPGYGPSGNLNRSPGYTATPTGPPPGYSATPTQNNRVSAV